MQGQVLRRGAAWIFTGKASDQVLTFLFGIVLARLLAPEVFGMLLTLQVFTGLAGFAAGGGMGQALVRARKVSQQDYDIVFTLQLLIGIAIYTAFFCSRSTFSTGPSSTFPAASCFVRCGSRRARPRTSARSWHRAA